MQARVATAAIDRNALFQFLCSQRVLSRLLEASRQQLVNAQQQFTVGHQLIKGFLQIGDALLASPTLDTSHAEAIKAVGILVAIDFSSLLQVDVGRVVALFREIAEA